MALAYDSQRMPRLMDGPSEPLEDIVWLEPGCHPHIRRVGTPREGVDRHLQAYVIRKRCGVKV